jgi:hypothetical protein
MKPCRRDNITPFSLDRFNENGGCILRAQYLSENQVFNFLCTFYPSGRIFEF